MASEQTLVLVKPDGMMKGVAVSILQRYINVGLRAVKIGMLRMTVPLAIEFYKEHQGKFFFEGLVLAMTSGQICAFLLEGENAVAVVRELNGATDPAKATEGTIRNAFRSAGGPFNTVHGSDSPESAIREIALIFGRVP